MANPTGENSSTCIQSLVCEACRSGPFAPGSFQQAIVTNPEDSTGGFSYTTTWGEIGNSALKGCNWCTLLTFVRWTRPGTAIASEPPEKVFKVRICVEFKSMEYGSALWLFIDSITFGAFHIYADHGDEAAKYFGTGDQPRAELSFPDYKKASEWIDECASGTHKFCPKQEEVVLPTRVIDVSKPKEPKLLITGGLRRGRYAALSYVWGKGEKQPLRTTTENEKSYVDGINVPLPQTIVDAMVVSHELGLDYLWVDSLCILQDSKDDKEKEMAQMRAIYGNAYVTILAESAYGVNDGFLEDQRPTAFRLPFQCPGGNDGSMLVHCGSSLPDSRSLGLGSNGIHTRAWCFQEMVLSPRQLCFSRPSLFFRCRSNDVHTITGDIIGVPSQPRPNNTYLLFPNKRNVPLSDDDLSQLRTLWHEILRDYSAREMGRASDKLVAIAGVVEAFQRVWKGDCIAGLWRETLIEDLLWRRPVYPHYPRPANYLLPRPDYYRAPSWSWAAIDGEIEPHRDHFTGIPSITYECEILECKTTPKSDLLPWGEVTDGILRINAKMKEVKWDPNNGKLVEPGSLWNGSEETEADHNTRSQDQVCPDSAEEVTKSSRYVWLVLLRLGKTPSSGEPWAHGLFVVPVAGEDRYRRVGTLRCLRVPYWYEKTVKRKITII